MNWKGIYRGKQLALAFFGLWIVMSILVLCPTHLHRISRFSSTYENSLYGNPEDFNGFDNISGTGGHYVVPNIIHFIRFGQPRFSFVDSVCVLAALKNQRPDRIMFHTDAPYFTGKYWELLWRMGELKEKIELKFLRVPEEIYGQLLSVRFRKYHGADVARLMVLMEYGGIFLDNDSYIVKSLNEFRRFEMTLGWKEGGNISNQVIVAHRNARFLREWLLTYKDNYKPDVWFYNAGIRPTQAVLTKRPELVHRVPKRLAEYHGIAKMLYLEKTGEWRAHFAIHLFVNHHSTLIRRNLSSVATYPVVFNHDNIHHYPTNFREMVYDVFPFSYLEDDRLKDLN